MNGTDQETALLREELAKLLTTLKHNREKVPLEVLKTKYRKGYTGLPGWPVPWKCGSGSHCRDM